MKGFEISQKIISAEANEYELEELDDREPPKAYIDMLAKHALSKSDYTWYKNNFDLVKPHLINDLNLNDIKVNHFKTALNDPEVKERYGDNRFFMAVLHAFAEFKDKGHSIFELPWFKMTKRGNDDNQKRQNKM